MKLDAEMLKQMSFRATPGPWTRSHHIVYGPASGAGGLVGLFADIKYLNHTADPTHASNNARFVTALVNAYRAGELVLREEKP